VGANCFTAWLTNLRPARDLKPPRRGLEATSLIAILVQNMKGKKVREEEKRIKRGVKGVKGKGSVK
jgi:hypothetical protein